MRIGIKRVSAALAVAALALVPAALGDAVFHAAHVPLSPVGAAPLRSGFVEIAHADGPVRFAHDVYSVNGATPATTYTVTLHLSTGADPSCSVPFVDAPVATLTTGAAGNGEADAAFAPALIDALGVRNSTVYVRFTLDTGGTAAYTTPCGRAQLD